MVFVKRPASHWRRAVCEQTRGGPGGAPVCEYWVVELGRIKERSLRQEQTLLPLPTSAEAPCARRR